LSLTRRTSLTGILLLVVALHSVPVRATELDVGAMLGGTAPLTEVLRRAQPGLAFAGELVYGPLPYLEFGARYSLGWFPQEERDTAGNVKEPVLDHGVGALVRFVLSGSRQVGWLDGEGWMRDAFWLDADLAYHMIGRESCFGFAAGFGYEFRPRRSFYLSPLVRFENVFGTSQGTASYVVIGLAGGYDFGRLIDRTDDEDHGAGSSAGAPDDDYATVLPPDDAPAAGEENR
jgi:hypothetical protein